MPCCNQLSSSYPDGKHKVKYQHGADWDFQIEDRDAPIDLSLILPHYRARYQPVDHRMTMFVAGNTESIKLKVVCVIPLSSIPHLTESPAVPTISTEQILFISIRRNVQCYRLVTLRFPWTNPLRPNLQNSLLGRVYQQDPAERSSERTCLRFGRSLHRGRCCDCYSW